MSGILLFFMSVLTVVCFSGCQADRATPAPGALEFSLEKYAAKHWRKIARPVPVFKKTDGFALALKGDDKDVGWVRTVGGKGMKFVGLVEQHLAFLEEDPFSVRRAKDGVANGVNELPKIV